MQFTSQFILLISIAAPILAAPAPFRIPLGQLGSAFGKALGKSINKANGGNTFVRDSPWKGEVQCDITTPNYERGIQNRQAQDENAQYLQGKPETCFLQPHSAGRISCSWGSAIWAVNNNAHVVGKPCSHWGDMALTVLNNCELNGQTGDEGVVIIQAGADC
ncbi:hypothetical protein BJ508DRAFT_330610 [Ascobolus immersus RN42]|uniref:Ecp2 effector protein domain-containing protein n=1 Tax=Ascobolus immersus RN42 TaxID=1160509 RepID=A0A3N4HWQ2_ASCIM|nr:hypothetical protein BJ508DRAFT_330610 [Ascobolus immersus RN42]